MKKGSAITFAAFYLLLTTGLYVCMLHCTADYFLGTHEEQIAGHVEHAEKSGHHKHKSAGTGKKECGKDADCNCCNTHGQYVIKENVPAGPKIYITTAELAVSYACIADDSISWAETAAITWPHGNAPPFTLKEPLYISYRSLLI